MNIHNSTPDQVSTNQSASQRISLDVIYQNSMKIFEMKNIILETKIVRFLSQRLDLEEEKNAWRINKLKKTDYQKQNNKLKKIAPLSDMLSTLNWWVEVFSFFIQSRELMIWIIIITNEHYCIPLWLLILNMLQYGIYCTVLTFFIFHNFKPLVHM